MKKLISGKYITEHNGRLVMVGREGHEWLAVEARAVYFDTIPDLVKAYEPVRGGDWAYGKTRKAAIEYLFLD